MPVLGMKVKNGESAIQLFSRINLQKIRLRKVLDESSLFDLPSYS